VEGLSHTSERLCSQVLTVEIALDQLIDRFTDSHGIGLRQSLYPGCNVGRFSQGELFLTSLPTHVPHNDEPRMHPDTESKVEAFGLLQMGMQVAHGSEDTQASAYSALGVIFMGVWIAKIDQQSITKELGHISVKTLDDVCAHLLIRTDHVSQVLRVKVR